MIGIGVRSDAMRHMTAMASGTSASAPTLRHRRRCQGRHGRYLIPGRSTSATAPVTLARQQAVSASRLLSCRKPRHSRRAVPTQRSAMALAFGTRTGVPITCTPSASKTASNTALNFASRSWRSKRKAFPRSPSATKAQHHKLQDTPQRPIHHSDDHQSQALCLHGRGSLPAGHPSSLQPARSPFRHPHPEGLRDRSDRARASLGCCTARSGAQRAGRSSTTPVRCRRRARGSCRSRATPRRGRARTYGRRGRRMVGGLRNAARERSRKSRTVLALASR